MLRLLLVLGLHPFLLLRELFDFILPLILVLYV